MSRPETCDRGADRLVLVFPHHVCDVADGQRRLAAGQKAVAQRVYDGRMGTRGASGVVEPYSKQGSTTGLPSCILELPVALGWWGVWGSNPRHSA